LYRIKWLKETSESGDVKAWDVSALQGQLNELSQEPPAPPPPPPPPPSSLEMTVESDKAFTPLRWDKDGDSVFVLLREIAYASMRRDTAFFERVLDDDYVGVGPDGATRNKAEEIEAVKRLDSIKKFEFDDLRVSGNDDVAFATFLATVHFQTNSQDSTAQYRYTINFIKKDVPFDAKVPAEHIEPSGATQVSCLKCHAGTQVYKMPLAKVKEKAKQMEMKEEMVKEMLAAIEGAKSDERVPDETKPSFKHADVLPLHPGQLKIAAIHMSRKQ